MKRILLIGEPMCLLISKEYGLLEDVTMFDREVSGAELNVAIGLTRLGYEVEYVTKLGNDPFGKNILKFLEKENLKTNYIEFSDEKRTGMQLKSKAINSDPDIFYFRKDSAASTIDIDYLKKIDLEKFDLIHITGIPLAISKSFSEAIFDLAKRAKKLNKIISFDPNIRLQMWDNKDNMRKTILEFSEIADIILPGIHECEILFSTENLDEIANKFEENNIPKFIIKDGANGSYYYDKKYTFKKGFKVKEVIDTVGAGDGFAVGVISSILEKLKVDEMLTRANAIGAIQVSNISDNKGLPTRENLEKYIKENENEA